MAQVSGSYCERCGSKYGEPHGPNCRVLEAVGQELHGPVFVADEPCVPNGFGLCTTHPSCDHVQHTLKEAQAKIEDQRRELAAREEILQGFADEGNSWTGWLGWRQRMRDFANDSEEHRIDKKDWKAKRSFGVTLYAKADYFVAYWDDAAVLWEQSDDGLPMFHVMVKSSPPHRTVIHALHLAKWVQHLAESCLPVLICNLDDLERIE